MRRNTQVTLCLQNGGEGASRLVHVHGALVRDLRPDEKSLAERVRLVSSPPGGGSASSNSDPLHQEHPELKGIYSEDGSLKAALEKMLACEPPPAVLLLAASGLPIEEVCVKMSSDSSVQQSGVCVVLGDNRGLSQEDEADILAAVKRRGASLHTVSLGADVLFASHSIVLLHHYLDKGIHSCKVKPPREMAASARTSFKNWKR